MIQNKFLNKEFWVRKLKNNRFFKKAFIETFLSIDVGFRNIKLVEVDVERDLETNIHKIYIKNYAIAATPRGCIKNGHIKDVKKATKEIRKAIINSGIKAKKAKIVMSGTHIISRVLKGDIDESINMDENILKIISKNMPINTEEYQIDYKILEQTTHLDKNKVKFLLTAVRKTITSSYIDILVDLNLTPISVDIPANSATKFFNRDIILDEKYNNSNAEQIHKNDNGVFMVIDFGSETTIVNILKNKQLEFNKILLKGSSNIEEAIAGVTSKSIEESERIKKMYGMTRHPTSIDEEKEKIYSVVKENVDYLVTQINQCIDFYKKKCYGTDVSKVYIIGGGSLLKGMKEYLETELNVPVYPIGLFNIEGIEISDNLDGDKINYLINSVGITL